MTKIRIRTKKELRIRKILFLKIIKILKKEKIFYFLQGGVLLGARREKNFIKWDWDVEVSIFSKDFLENFEKIKKELKKNKFKIKNYNLIHFAPKISFYKTGHTATSFSIIGWHHSFLRGAYTRTKLKIPMKFMNKMEKINFFNQNFFCPGPIDEYLKFQYGNWKKPIRSDKKQLYLTESFYNKNENFFDVVNKLINLVNIFKKKLYQIF